jgi:hypothetical protein
MKFELPHQLSALLLLAPLALAPLGCDSGDEGDDEAADMTDDTTDTGGDPLAGQMIHDSTCAVGGCHSAADMVQLSERVPLLDDAGLTDQIRTGSVAPDMGMPAFTEAIIDTGELADLIAFLRQEYPA